MANWSRLGIIAGAGALPARIAAKSQALGRPCFVARLPGAHDPALAGFAGGEFGFGQVEARFAALRAFGCDGVVFAGQVRRPNLSDLRVDGAGLALLPKFAIAAGKGDDALQRLLVTSFEAAGFHVLAVEEILGDALAPTGPLGAIRPDGAALSDIAKGAALIAALDAFDVGQGCVVRAGLVLAIEAQEGTDAMLARAAMLRSDAQFGGVLIKRCKPSQERRIDLPTIGLATLEGAAHAGLAGIALEAKGALIVDAPEVRACADGLGLFVFGFDPADLPS
jgi:UDP-2,3-diacylglucosamine hydrolase